MEVMGTSASGDHTFKKGNAINNAPSNKKPKMENHDKMRQESKKYKFNKRALIALFVFFF
jgi:hypothetical protein